MKKVGIWMLLAAGLLLGGCGKAGQSEMTGMTVLSDANAAVMEINGEEVSLREWNFYVRMNQMQWEKSYLDSYGEEMWSRETDEEGTTLADELKEEVREIICEACILNQKAEAYDVVLEEETRAELKKRAQAFMEGYHEALLAFAGADEEFVYGLLCRNEVSERVAKACVADYEPELSEEEIHREGICYVLISTTGLRDEEGNLTPFSEEEIARRDEAAVRLCEAARESGDLKGEAEAMGLSPIESSMGKDNEGDGQEPLMLNAARTLAVGEISDPVKTDEGWFLVQHTSDYDEEGTEYWREYLTELARGREYETLYEGWRKEAKIVEFPEIMDRVNVKNVLKELL